MKTVILESPYASSGITTKDQNILYARKCLRDCIDRGEAPFASHLLYTQVLNDDDPEERNLGIRMGYQWWVATDYIVFYTDLGWSRGMITALQLAINSKHKFWIRSLTGKPQSPPVISDEGLEQLITARLDRTTAGEQKNDQSSEEVEPTG
jgi:hypothetical protein